MDLKKNLQNIVIQTGACQVMRIFRRMKKILSLLYFILSIRSYSSCIPPPKKNPHKIKKKIITYLEKFNIL